MKPLPPGIHASLACGIIALILFWMPLAGLVGGITALVLAQRARRFLVAEPDRYRETDFIAAGRICGLVGLTLSVLTNLVWLILIGAVIHAFASGAQPEPPPHPLLW
jgi:uncharacterized membrane protein YkgB